MTLRNERVRKTLMKEIADILDVCESRISQILSCALEQLKKTWENREEELYDNVRS